MRLDYRILWIEDSTDWAESIKDNIREIIESYGLHASFTILLTESEDQRYNGYNLILMDLGLAGGRQGDALIEQIRSLNVFTNIVFYSASGVETVKNKGRDLNLEGVYYADRKNELFLRKVNNVINASLQSFQDLVYLRGLVMAEVSELDSKMDSIIETYFINDTRMTEFHGHVTKDRESSTKRNLKGDCDKSCKHKWRTMELSAIMKKLDSNSRAHAVNVVISYLASTGHIFKEFEEESFYERYDKDIITMRNNLAHCVEAIEDDDKPILKTKDGDITFTKAEITTIRKNIRFYNEMFDRITKQLVSYSGSSE